MKRAEEMSPLDVLRLVGDPSGRAAIGVWAQARCRDIRRRVLQLMQKEPAQSSAPGGRVCSVGAEDVKTTYLSQDDFAALLGILHEARAESRQPPPANLSPREAFFYLARSQILILLTRYARSICAAAAFQTGLRTPRSDGATVEIDNLLCEPDDDDHSAFLWTAVWTALYDETPGDPVRTSQLQNLLARLDCVVEIFYNLSSAVYSTDQVLVCRRAFAAFRRHLGRFDFQPAWEAFVAQRQALDTAICNKTAERFASAEKSLDLMAHELLRLRQLLESSAASSGDGTSATPETPRRGPHGRRQEVSVKYAAQVYGVSPATICNWENGKGAIPVHYPGRNVTIDAFNRAATLDCLALGHRQGVIRRISDALGSR